MLKSQVEDENCFNYTRNKKEETTVLHISLERSHKPR